MIQYSLSLSLLSELRCLTKNGSTFKNCICYHVDLSEKFMGLLRDAHIWLCAACLDFVSQGIKKKYYRINVYLILTLLIF